MFDFHGESFDAVKCFLNFSEKYSSSSYTSFIRCMRCILLHGGGRGKKKKEEKLIHGAFKQGLPTKIFFHGLVHVDSCDPWETSELRCRKHQGGKYQAFKKLGRSDTVFTAITIFLTRSPFSLFNYIPENIRSSITKFSSLLIFFSLPYTFFPLVSPPLSCPRLLFFLLVLISPWRIDARQWWKIETGPGYATRFSLGHFERWQRGDSKSWI